MPTTWREGKIRCPFFRGESSESHQIFCEGLGDSYSVSWNFRKRRERQRIRQMEVFCQDCYTNCEMYRMIRESKYDD